MAIIAVRDIFVSHFAAGGRLIWSSPGADCAAFW